MNIILPSPRGFCAGVTRAIEILEATIKKNIDNKQIYVFNYIVHNQYIIDYFKNKGVIFIKSIEEIKNKSDSIVIFSAHGVSENVEKSFNNISSINIDASCPLVKKIHRNVTNLSKDEYHIIIIGKHDHPEVIGTAGRIKNTNNYSIVFSKKDIDNLKINKSVKLAYVIQTTLGVFETQDTLSYLKNKFPNIVGQDIKDICYASKNRQDAIHKAILKYKIDYAFIIGAHFSSNSHGLKNVLKSYNIKTNLVNNEKEIDINNIDDNHTILITSAASAPEILVEKTLQKLNDYFNIKIIYFNTLTESVNFKIPSHLM